MRSQYQSCEYVSELPPHIFSVLETAYRFLDAERMMMIIMIHDHYRCRSMRTDRESQSVILTGERGAGKSSLMRSSLEEPGGNWGEQAGWRQAGGGSTEGASAYRYLTPSHLQYLTLEPVHLQKRASNNVHRVLDAITVLEAFTTAQTVSRPHCQQCIIILISSSQPHFSLTWPCSKHDLALSMALK